MQHNKYFEYLDVKIYCATKCFTELKFLGSHNTPRGVRGLSNNYHMHFDLKLGHITCVVRRTPCAFTFCIYIIDQHWVTIFPENKQPCYETVQN